MDLRQIITEANTSDDRKVQEDLRNLKFRQEPYLAESSQLSNKLAGSQGERYKRSDPEGYAADEKRYNKLQGSFQRFESERLDILGRQNATPEPIDPRPLLEQAKKELEQSQHVLRWASYQGLRHRSVAYITDVEREQERIRRLRDTIEVLELAIEAEEEIESREEVTV